MTKFDRITDKQTISNTVNQFNDMNLDKNSLAKTIVDMAPVDLDELADYFENRFGSNSNPNPQLA